MRMILGVIALLACIAAQLAYPSLAWGLEICGRVPDEATNPPPNPLDLLVLDPKNREIALYANSYALIIGESSYQHMTALGEVPSEMRRLRQVLEGHGFDVSLFMNLDSANLLQTIDCFVRSVATFTEARVVIYFAGHGATRQANGKNIGYVLPTDIPGSTSHPDFVKKALRLSQFLEWASLLEVKHALFIFDSCFSGAIFQNRSAPDALLKPSNYIFSPQAQSPVRQFLAAGSAEETVPAQSVFLDLLIQALLGEREEADSNKDRFLTGKELINYIVNTVPNYSAQTPTEGRISDPNLDRGEFVFKLPSPGATFNLAPTTVMWKEANGTFRDQIYAMNGQVQSDFGTVSPVYQGTQIAADAPAIAKIYEAEEILATSTENCPSDCDPATKKRTYTIDLVMPAGLPPSAVFADPALSCIGCSGAFDIKSTTILAPDRRTVRVEFESWERSATWRLKAKVLVKNSSSSVMLLDTASNKLSEVNPNRLSTISETPDFQPEKRDRIRQLTLDLQSDETLKRRGARVELAKYVGADDGATIAQLIRGMNTGTYRYQLGIAEALSRAPDGWKTSESTSRDILLTAAKRTKDPSLDASISSALRNIRASVYYEVGLDGWLTESGQLKPLNVKKPPLPDYASLKKGDVLKAASSVYLRAGASVSSGALDILAEGECVRVIQREEERALTSDWSGGWLQVVRHECSTGE